MHLEDVCKVPERSRSLEKQHLHFPDDDDGLHLDSLEVRRSPGMMLEDRGKCVADNARHVSDSRKRISKGMLERLVTGNYIVYSVATKQKVCKVGKVLTISRPENSCIVHYHRAVCDCHLRMEWKPVYVENGTKSSTAELSLSRRRLRSVASYLQCKFRAASWGMRSPGGYMILVGELRLSMMDRISACSL